MLGDGRDPPPPPDDPAAIAAPRGPARPPPPARLAPLLAAAEALAGLGSWETDLRTRATVWSDGMFRVLGLEPSDAPRSSGMIAGSIHPDDRPRIAALLETVETAPESIPREGVYAAFRVVRPDGTVADIRGHGRVERDAEEAPVRWVGALQDVSDEVLTERELQARYAVSQALREWESFEEGLVTLLRRLATALDYPYASLWIWDADAERIVCRAFWSEPDREGGSFEAVTRSLRFRRGEGLPGKVWESGAALARRDLATDPEFRRPDVAVDAGLTSTLGFPAVGPDGTVAVLFFYSLDPRDPSARLLRTLSGIGSELGRFLSRRRGDLEARRLSARELEVLRMAAEGNSGPEIAECLVLSPSTIKTHFENIYEKLGVGDRAAAVAHALRLGLIS